MQIASFEGFRPAAAQSTTLNSAPSTSYAPARRALVVRAGRKVVRKMQVVLGKDLPNLGKVGTLTSVSLGYYRNYLLPQGLAGPATQEFLNKMVEEEASKQRLVLESKAKAQAMATALKTIGKFVIKKKAGENDAIFGSVSTAEIVEAIRQQTGREVDRRLVTFPIEPKTLGTFDCNVRLHPEVLGSFKIVVQKEKGASGK